jgi:hypothetical protein
LKVLFEIRKYFIGHGHYFRPDRSLEIEFLAKTMLAKLALIAILAF